MSEQKINWILWLMCMVLILSMGIFVFNFTSQSKYLPPQETVIKAFPTPAKAKADSVQKTYSIEEVSTHSSSKSCWIIYNKKVIDITEMLNLLKISMPGELNYCGKDATTQINALFNQNPSYKGYQTFIDYFSIGLVK